MKKFVFLAVLFFVLLLGCSSNLYTVTFLDAEGNVIEVKKVSGGDSVTAPKIDAPEGYEFVAWNYDLTHITESVDVKPKFEKIECLVTFIDSDGTELKKVRVPYGENATAPSVTPKEGYVFDKWNYDYTNVKNDLVIMAIYKTQTFVVQFYKIDGTIHQSGVVAFGADATPPTPDNIQGMQFVGWDTDYTNVKSDLSIKPIYTETSFKVKFVDDEGNILKEELVEKGKGATAPDPTKDGFTFKSWDKDFSNVTSELTVTALYDLIEYTITYYDGKNILNLAPSSYNIKSQVFLPEPEKDGFVFLGWYYENDQNNKIVSLLDGETGNKKFYAKWEEIIDESIVLPQGSFYFTSIKKVPHSSVSGLFVYQPDFSSITGTAPSTSVSNYNWASSNTDIATISAWPSISTVSSGFAVISATYKADTSIVGYVIIKTTADGVFASTEEEANSKKEYTVTFKDSEGNVIEKQTVKEGQSAILPTPLDKEGYYFFGWDKVHYGITSDTTITAIYKEGTLDYSGKTVSILGDSISTYKGFVPDGYACFYPYPTADIGDVNQTWWMQVIDKFGMKLLKNNSYSGTCVASDTHDATSTDSRLQELLKNGEIPDVIIIFMGANDCGSRYVTLDTFTSSYKQMLEKIKVLCPDSEIIICTLPPAGLYSESERISYNKVIRAFQVEYEAILVDLETMYTQSEYTEYVCDSCHPNKKGMDKFAEKVISEILEAHNIE